jgi:hypothetical protein
LTASGALTVQSTGANALTLQSGGAAAVNMDTGAGAAINIGATNATSIVLGGNTTATITAKIANSSTTAFQLQTAGATAYITTDTTNKYIQIGSSSTDNVGIQLTLDSYNQTTDPVANGSGVNGSMYYNTSMAKFRCYENGVWKNCLNGVGDTISTIVGPTTTTAAKAAANIIYLTPIYIPSQMTINEMRANISTALGAAGDIGLYKLDSGGTTATLVLNGGSSSLTTTTGVKSVTPTQAAASRIMEPGQYWAAITWNSTTGVIHGATLGSTYIKRSGTLATGGLVLPNSITVTSITAGTVVPGISFNN